MSIINNVCTYETVSPSYLIPLNKSEPLFLKVRPATFLLWFKRKQRKQKKPPLNSFYQLAPVQPANRIPLLLPSPSTPKKQTQPPRQPEFVRALRANLSQLLNPIFGDFASQVRPFRFDQDDNSLDVLALSMQIFDKASHGSSPVCCLRHCDCCLMEADGFRWISNDTWTGGKRQEVVEDGMD